MGLVRYLKRDTADDRQNEHTNKPHKKLRRKAKKNPEKKMHWVKLKLFGVVVLVFAAGITFSYINSRVAVMGYQIGDIKGQISQLEEDQERLQIEASELSSLSRIEKIAVKDLGMVQPGQEDIVLVSSSASATAEDEGKADEAESGSDGEKDNIKENETKHSSILEFFANLIK